MTEKNHVPHRKAVNLKNTADPHTTPATPANSNSPNLTTIEAAQFLNIKPASLEMMRWRGNGPVFVKVGRCVRYRMAQLEEYLLSRTFSSTTEAGVGGQHE